MVNISEYPIVYPNGAEETVEGLAAHELQKEYLPTLDIVSDSASVSTRSVLVGNTNVTVGDMPTGNQYSVNIDTNGRIQIAAGSYYGYRAAIKALAQNVTKGCVPADLNLTGDASIDLMTAPSGALRVMYYNLYGYDNDFAAGRTETTPLSPAEVLASGYSICQGYSNLVQALCQAQEIPCIILTSWGAGTGTDGFISAEDDPYLTESNHTHTAAWVDGRWVHMDTTWDSPNRYENGIKTKGTSSGILYFDSQLDFFSRNHKIITVPAAVADNTPSEWAIPEVKLALERELVPFTLQKNYRTSITRAQFCQLLMTTLLRRMDADRPRHDIDSLKDLIGKKELTIDETIFTDIADLPNRLEILTANALGIVNGRGGGIFDPESGITRQEAATMLMRAAQVLEIPMGENPRSFSDMADADEWAAMGILYTSSLTDASGMAVMGGVDDSRFSPQTAYTVEQSILTMVRMSTVGSAYIP